MPNPHDNWADYYDSVYEISYGAHYQTLTSLTLQGISGILGKGTIIDYGAGTGRLAIPLKQQGYDVIAVEQSIEMLRVLNAKCAQKGLEIPTHQNRIKDYSNGEADLALALFTVMSYITTEDEMAQSLEAISRHLKPNGYFFFDLPNMVYFLGGQILNIQKPNLKRIVSINSTDSKGIYTYHEICSGGCNGVNFDYQEEFPLRFWSMAEFNENLNTLGLHDTGRVFSEFNGTGSTYKLYQKLK